MNFCDQEKLSCYDFVFYIINIEYKIIHPTTGATCTTLVFNVTNLLEVA